MESIKSWVLSTIVASLVAGLVYILSPKGSTQKILRVSSFVFVICTSLSPFFTGSIDLDFTLPEVQYDTPEENKLIESVKESMEKIVVNNMDAILKSMGVEGAEIKIFTDKNSDNSISISETVITVPNQYANMSENIRQKIKSELGYDVRVTT